MTIALILAGGGMALISAGLLGASGIDMETKGNAEGTKTAMAGMSFLFATCTCFYIAGTMAGAQ